MWIQLMDPNPLYKHTICNVLKTFAPFSIGFTVVFLLIPRSILYILDKNLLSVTHVIIIFSCSVAFLFTPLVVSWRQLFPKFLCSVSSTFVPQSLSGDLIPSSKNLIYESSSFNFFHQFPNLTCLRAPPLRPTRISKAIYPTSKSPFFNKVFSCLLCVITGDTIILICNAQNYEWSLSSLFLSVSHFLYLINSYCCNPNPKLAPVSPEVGEEKLAYLCPPLMRLSHW